MKSLAAVAVVLCSVALSASAQGKMDDKFSMFTGKGEPARFSDLLDSLKNADVVFLGEMHDDSVGHAFELKVFREVLGRYGKDREVALSLEMFERDVQYILDEYLSGKITEDHFLASSRPWNNYKTDYRPLVELAKEDGIPVIAANAPRRYVNMVTRKGRSSLDSLSKQAKRTLPPLPYPTPSEAYSKKFRDLMSAMPAAAGNSGPKIDNILDSQTLWDSSMAWWISRFLKKHKRGLVVHLNGSFHTESRLGTVEQLAKYRKQARAVVVTMIYEKDFKHFDPAKHSGLGDFVVLTDASQPRSRR